MKVALDEGPGPPIKYPNAELGKLHQVVSMLVRCTNVTQRCQGSNERVAVLPNTFADPHFVAAPPTAAAAAAVAAAVAAIVDPSSAADHPFPATLLSKEATENLYVRNSYTKKLLEDVSAGDDGLRLLQFCCWENPTYSRSVLSELLWMCSLTGHHLQDMRHHTELLLHVLLIQDSWQNHRVHNALNGVLDERDGLFTVMDRMKKNYPRRAYQLVKLLVSLFKQCPLANSMLHKSADLAQKWTEAVEWLQESLDRQRSGGSYGGYNWPGGAGNYEGGNAGGSGGSVGTSSSTSAYMLERNPSTKNTLRMACELCPDEVSVESFISGAEASIIPYASYLTT